MFLFTFPSGTIKSVDHFNVIKATITMLTASTLVIGFLLNFAYSFEIESFENIGIEESPLYEMIIYNDLADVINEFKNNNIMFEKAAKESESDEDVEDLLSEYHGHLEKAHKQRVNYLEQLKLKNNIPIIRHEKFTKLKPLGTGNHKEYYKNSYNNPGIYPETLSPLNMFIPFNYNKHLTTSEREPVIKEGLNLLNKFSFAKTTPFSNMPVESSCNCKDGRKSCKECIMPLNNIHRKIYPKIILPDEEMTMYSNNPFNISLPNTLNIRIKVDVHVPNADNYNQFYNNQNPSKITDYDSGVSREYLSSIKLPSPYFNTRIPINLFGHKGLIQSDKYDTLSSSPLYKSTVQKKKKTKLSNGLKKHRKNVIAFNNLKTAPLLQPQREIFNTHKAENSNATNTVTVNSETYVTYKPNSMSTITPIEMTNITQNQTENSEVLLANTTSNIENVTINVKNKTGNSIEAEYTNTIPNPSTDKIHIHLLRKREIKPENKSIKTIEQAAATENTSVSAKANDTTITKNKIKKAEESIPPDTELLYWPNNSLNNTKDNFKNITAIILENENKKGKLNVSADTIRLNHTRVLEQAIFGNVDWNDVDSVAPAFISFFGKYIEGVISFCSERICHSMKCTKNICIHRVCTPRDRFNNKGHCTGSNNTDSATSMESTMDLPSNIAFEIVDILKDRMMGQLFGKITLCINSKCITLVASKKLFLKNKCTEKQLSPKGHCEVVRS